MAQESHPAKPPSSRTVEDALRPHRKALAALLRTPALSMGDVATALAQVTEVAVDVLGVERASVWRFDEKKSRIECVELYERSRRAHSSGLVLERSAAPRYFDALDEERTIAAENARTDPRTAEFREGYLEPQNIHALLDAPVFAGPQLIGVVCHEHVGATRPWRLWEELVASTLADFVALVLATSERIASDKKLADHRSHLERLIEERTAKLQETEVNLRKLFEASPVPMLLANAADQRVLLANRRAVEVFSMPVAPARLVDFWVHPEDGARLMEDVTREQHLDAFVTELVGKRGVFFAELAVERITYDGDDALLVGVHDVTRQRDAEAALRELATRDGLTGVLNRRRFVELAGQESLRHDRFGQAFSVALLDVDHFKAINDRHGHGVGDSVLRLLAEKLEAGVRKVDIVARYGGEEFVILFPQTDRAGAAAVVERLHATIRRASYDTPNGSAHFTVSIGLIERAKGEPLEEAVARADRAMYRAKESGRDNIVLD